MPGDLKIQPELCHCLLVGGVRQVGWWTTYALTNSGWGLIFFCKAWHIPTCSGVPEDSSRFCICFLLLPSVGEQRKCTRMKDDLWTYYIYIYALYSIRCKVYCIDKIRTVLCTNVVLLHFPATVKVRQMKIEPFHQRHKEANALKQSQTMNCTTWTMWQLLFSIDQSNKQYFTDNN